MCVVRAVEVVPVEVVPATAAAASLPVRSRHASQSSPAALSLLSRPSAAREDMFSLGFAI